MHLVKEELRALTGSGDKDFAVGIAQFVDKELLKFTAKFQECPCDECQASAAWGKAASCVISMTREDVCLIALDGYVRAGLSGILHLASQGATTELVRRVEKAKKHRDMSLPITEQI